MRYKVTRWCCRSGNCTTCFANGNLKARKRIVQADNLKEEAANKAVHGWQDYEAKKELDTQP